CPSFEVLDAWLEAAEADPLLERHLRGCPACRAAVDRQAAGWLGEGLWSLDHLRGKLAAAGLARAPAGPGLLEALLDWSTGVRETAAQTIEELGAVLLRGLLVRNRLQLANVRFMGEGETGFPGPGDAPAAPQAATPARDLPFPLLVEE